MQDPRDSSLASQFRPLLPQSGGQRTGAQIGNSLQSGIQSVGVFLRTLDLILPAEKAHGPPLKGGGHPHKAVK